MKRATIAILLVICFIPAIDPAWAQTYEQLIAGAKKEGRLVLYASATAPQLQMYFSAFNKKYLLSGRNSFAPAKSPIE